MGLENQVCYNGGAHGTKYKQSRFPLIIAIAPPPPAVGGNLKKLVFEAKSENGIVTKYTSCALIELVPVFMISG